MSKLGVVKDFLKSSLKPVVRPAAATLAAGGLLLGDARVDDHDSLCAQSAYTLEGHKSAQIDKVVKDVRARVANFPDSTLQRGSLSKDVNPAITFERKQLAGYEQALSDIIKQARSCAQDTSALEQDHDRFAKKAEETELNLDLINQQLETPFKKIKIEGPKIGVHELPVYKFDLRPENIHDDRIPYVLCGTYLGDVEHNTELALSLALRGEKVFAFPYPERTNVVSPSDWAERLTKDGTFALHAEYVKEIIKNLVLKNVNVVGFSLGGSVALEMARDPEFDRINDLLVMEPVGFSARTREDMGWSFVVDQGLLRMVPDAEAMAKSFVYPWNEKHGLKDGMEGPVQSIVMKQQFNDHNLVQVDPNGRYQVWLADESPVSCPETTEITLKIAEGYRTGPKSGPRNPMSPLEVLHLVDGHHTTPSIQTLGILKESKDPYFAGTTYFNAGDLQNSAAWMILDQLKGKNN